MIISTGEEGTTLGEDEGLFKAWSCPRLSADNVGACSLRPSHWWQNSA